MKHVQLSEDYFNTEFIFLVHTNSFAYSLFLLWCEHCLAAEILSRIIYYQQSFLLFLIYSKWIAGRGGKSPPFQSYFCRSLQQTSQNHVQNWFVIVVRLCYQVHYLPQSLMPSSSSFGESCTTPQRIEQKEWKDSVCKRSKPLWFEETPCYTHGTRGTSPDSSST